MTSADTLPPAGPDTHLPDYSAATLPPRKRRRRTATSGATDDCFACRKRAVACDRKRPYCTQCIEIGKECTGYKTTLTWGVGVASRGKLRGLSCPVAHKNGEASTVAPGSLATPRRKNSSNQRRENESVGIAPAAKSSFHPHMSGPPSLPSPAPGPTAYSSSTPVPIPIPPLPEQAWQIPPFPTSNQSRSGENRRPSFNGVPLQRLQTTFSTQFDARAVPPSATSMGSFVDTDFHSAHEYPRTPGSISYLDRMHAPSSAHYNAHQPLLGSPHENPSMHSPSIGSYSDALSSSIDTVTSTAPTFADPAATPHDGGLNTFSTGILAHGDMLMDPFADGALGYDAFVHAPEQFHDDETELHSKDVALMDTRFSSPFFHLAPRMQSLLEYYDRHICPFIVAFDGPENPYRKHILQLAMHNEGLQHAIAALATNNFRMRQQPPPRQLGFVEELSDAMTGYGTNPMSEASAEESFYKQASIERLNMQLTDTRAAQDDSVLATLLILCLFHVCDSGFSKFKTQLAGVQKLLTLRGPVGQSDFTRWVEMFFIWFDVMTSTVNDREMQIKPESLDMLDFSANLGALEQFSGCDGRLFKLIARLGRLNLLAQGRPVRRQDGLETVQETFQRKRPMPPRALSARDFENFDGNGWGSPIFTPDDEADGASDPSSFSSSAFPAFDNRRDFWTEWHDIRSRLQAWEMDASTASTSLPSPSHEVESGQRDLVHINESFRHSALLYTERLGNPVLPSAHPTFQQYVSQALFHITALPVTSCVNKFLLWPLFITGTECVDVGHRAIVRSRCVEVHQESGFFNNLSSLEVLERVWSDGSRVVAGHDVGSSGGGLGPGVADGAAEMKARRRDSEAARTGLYGPAFRWRKAMDRIDGEYIVI